MLTNVNRLCGFHIWAVDGQIGTAHDFVVEDGSWIIRYVTVDTGNWLPGRRVLVSPASISAVDLEHGIIRVSLTVDQIRSAPDIYAHPTVTRQHELQLAEYYDWPRYWDHDVVYRDWKPFTTLVRTEQTAGGPAGGASMLRSTREMTGYRIQAIDGRIGHIDDFLLKTDDWMIRYLVADTRNWLPGKHVLVATQWVLGLDSIAERIEIDLSRDDIRHAPPFDAHAMDAALEAR